MVEPSYRLVGSSVGTVMGMLQIHHQILHRQNGFVSNSCKLAIISNLDTGMFMAMPEYFTKREIPAGYGDVR